MAVVRAAASKPSLLGGSLQGARLQGALRPLPARLRPFQAGHGQAGRGQPGGACGAGPRRRHAACRVLAAGTFSAGFTPGDRGALSGAALLQRVGAAAGVINERMPAILLGVVAWAWYQPQAFTDVFYPASWAGLCALAATQLAVGMAVPLEDFRNALRSPGRVLDGLVLQLLILPGLALLMSRLLGLPPAYALGLCLVACCPGGSAAGVVSHLAGGDVPLSVLMCTASMLCVGFTAPMLARLLVGAWLPVSATGMAITTLQVVLLPTLAGVALGEVLPAAAAALRPLFTLAASGLMALHCASYVAASGAALRFAWPQLLLAVVALHAGGLLLGYSLSKALGLPEPAARSNSVQAGMRNSALAGQLAALHYPAHPLAALPCALSACAHTVLATAAALYFQHSDASRGGAALAPPPGEQQQGGGGGGDGGPPPEGPDREPFSALLAAAARQLSPLVERTGETLAGLASTTRSTMQSALAAGAGLLVPHLQEEVEAQLREMADLDPEAPPRRAAPANPLAMNVVMVGAECAPWSKTGGLGDVMQALPKALAVRGHRVTVICPRYRNYEEAWDTSVRLHLHVFGNQHEVGYFHTCQDGVDYLFVDHPAFHNLGDSIYGGSRTDVLFRCALLSKAALEAPCAVPCGGRGPMGDSNLLFIANDYHSALVPVYLQAHYRDHGQLQYARSLLVLHNMAHQGRGPPEEVGLLDLPESYHVLFRMRDPDHGGPMMNVLKAGVVAAHRIVAVSSKYAEECQTPEFGCGLDGVLRRQAWKLHGVVNGIDTHEWSPAADAHLRGGGYANYDALTLDAGKARCKAALQRELGLPVDPSAPLLGFIGRLDFQKGVDLIADNYEWLMEQGAQLVLLGSGREDLEAALREMEARTPAQCRAWVGFSVRLAHRITAGCDLLLMPSRFEPCGLNQLYAMAYGTVPVVHAVGGLADTVAPFNPHEDSGTGWTFQGGSPEAFRQALRYALLTYREHRESFRGIQLRGMEQDLSWGAAAQQYEALLLAAKYQW